MKINICRERHGRRCLLSSHHNMRGKYVTQLSWKVSATPGMTQLNKEPSNCAFTQPLSLPSNQLGCIHSHSLFERARMPLVLAAPTSSAGLRPALSTSVDIGDMYSVSASNMLRRSRYWDGASTFLLTVRNVHVQTPSHSLSLSPPKKFCILVIYDLGGSP